MKKIIILLVFLVILSCLSITFGEVGVENTIKDSLSNFEYVEEVVVTEKDNHLLVQFNLTYFDEQMIYYIEDIINNVYSFVEVDSLTLQVYDEGLPYLKVLTLKKDALNYREGVYDRNEYIEKLKIEDVRSIEKVIYDDLSVFDSYIYGINVGENSAIIQLEYMAKDEDFLEEIHAMGLTIVEDAPWINDVTFELYDQKTLLMTVYSIKSNFLDIVDGSISEEEFINNLIVEKTKALEELNQVNREETTVEEESEMESSEEKKEVKSESQASEEISVIQVEAGVIQEEITTKGLIYELNVKEDGEYQITVENMEEVSVSVRIKDRNGSEVETNISEDELKKYTFVELNAGEKYFMELIPADEEFTSGLIHVTTEPAGSLVLFFLVPIVIFAGIVLLVVRMIKKKRSKKS